MKELALLFVLTGGPGSGKTAIIEELKRRNHLCVMEDGRAIIQEQQRSGGDALPWVNKTKFRDIMLARAEASHQKWASQGKIVFFDRGIPDLLGYSRLEEIEISETLKNAMSRYRYQKKVFITPPWEGVMSKSC